jgi:hypothetical protein
VRTEKPVPDPTKLLAHWMEWEKGAASPGQTLADLKRAGLRDLLEALEAAVPPAAGVSEEAKG